MYFDPITGSLAVQILIGLLVAVPVLVGVYWGKVKSLFRRRHGKDSD